MLAPGRRRAAQLPEDLIGRRHVHPECSPLPTAAAASIGAAAAAAVLGQKLNIAKQLPPRPSTYAAASASASAFVAATSASSSATAVAGAAESRRGVSRVDRAQAVGVLVQHLGLRLGLGLGVGLGSVFRLGRPCRVRVRADHAGSGQAVQVRGRRYSTCRSARVPASASASSAEGKLPVRTPA